MTDDRPLPGESAKAHEAFRLYCAQGAARSTARVAQELGKTKTLVDRWSSRWQWVARAAEHDAALHREEDAAMRERARTMGRRHADAAAALMVRALRALQAVTPQEIAPRDAVRMFDVATRVERDALGIAGAPQLLELAIGPVDGLDPEANRERMARLVAEARKRADQGTS
ncbi:hypothetical protein [Cellulosimicrobium sp. JZ28]|uniref:hypothetical protein n=1 Tax=Cellulosimicrobium sp. JZ28 TaxID=1906273 RepID=UPI00188D125A|nr:hypothetical protein [Cellulosimicrobium sp. JZ28]